MIEHIKAVLFDHDDTLVGTIEAKFAQHKHTAKKWYQKDLTDDELRLHWGKPLSHLFGVLYETDDIDTALAHVMEDHKDFPKVLFPDTIPTLEALHTRGLKLGLVTATSQFSLDHDLEDLGISRDLFDFIQSEEGSEHHKPDPRVFDNAVVWLKQYGIEPREVLYVGDGLHDARAATSAGFHFVGVETGLVDRQGFLDAGYDSVSTLAKIFE